MTDEELDALVKLLRNHWLGPHDEARVADAITALRTQLAEANARADRAEAERAAQIEVDAGIADALSVEWWGNYKDITHEHSYSQHREGMSDGADEIANAIRAQPRAGAAEHGSYDRTALDRMLAEAEARGYQLAADEAKQSGWHLRRYDLAKRDAELAKP